MIVSWRVIFFHHLELSWFDFKNGISANICCLFFCANLTLQVREVQTFFAVFGDDLLAFFLSFVKLNTSQPTRKWGVGWEWWILETYLSSQQPNGFCCDFGACLGGGFKYFFIFTSVYLGKGSILTNIFQMGWNHQLVVGWLIFCACWLTNGILNLAAVPSSCKVLTLTANHAFGWKRNHRQFLFWFGNHGQFLFGLVVSAFLALSRYSVPC